MTERQPGWYWCKDSYGDDIPLFWDNGWLTSDNYSRDSEYPKRVIDVGPRIPTPDEPWQMVPVEITAESGHKAGMMGDFTERWRDHCSFCYGSGLHEDDGEECEACEGSGVEHHTKDVSWTTIKAIHRRVVEIAAAPKPGGE